MKVVILAGGFGTRLSEYTDLIPKPMVAIGGRPILWHIMNLYSYYGYNDFIIALGYKAEIVKEYFLNFYSKNSDFTVDLSDNSIVYHRQTSMRWKITLVDTGLQTMTGGRLKRLEPYLQEENFMLTYGDGLSDVDIESLVSFHKEHKKLVTVTSVRPKARFGELVIDNLGIVESFKEKPQVHDGWINGGFFVINKRFIDYICEDSTILEKDPLSQASKNGELMAYRHEGFWQCMDTKRDRDFLDKLWE